MMPPVNCVVQAASLNAITARSDSVRSDTMANRSGSMIMVAAILQITPALPTRARTQRIQPLGPPSPRHQNTPSRADWRASCGLVTNYLAEFGTATPCAKLLRHYPFDEPLFQARNLRNQNKWDYGVTHNHHPR